MSSTRETPKKLAAVLEPKNSSCSGDCCRLCRCLFRVQKGDKFQHISTENLFKIPGKKGVEKRPLHELLSEDLGLHLSSNPNYSSRVCAKCALKIRNAVELVRFLKANLNPVANIGETSVECETQQRWKRMSKSPSSAEKPKSARIPTAEQESQAPVKNCRGLRVKKSFSFQRSRDEPDHTVDIIRANINFQKEAERLCKIESEKHVQTEVKVMLCGNGEVKLRTPSDKITKSLIKNAVLRKWKNVSNIVINHKDIEPFLRTALSCKVSGEFKQYCEGTNSILKGTSPEELAAYSNRFVAQETKVMCPFWHASLLGACGVHKCQEKKQKASNAIALATSVTARARNQRMSALVSRISVILLHSGAKTQDFTRLNRLGISLSHKQSIRLQTSMGNNFDGKVLQWKKKREDLLAARSLCKEIMEQQIPMLGEDDMELEIWCDLSEETTQHYEAFSANAHRALMDVVESCTTVDDHDVARISDTTMQIVHAKLEEQEPASYR